jgi:alanyl-tRNA synthetase
MSTHRLYYDDAYVQNFDARVLSCEATGPVVTEAGARAAWEILLDQTAFYPSSGGQPFDLGMIGEARILDVRDDGEEIVHVVDREVRPGEVAGCIDWARRFDHMQQHTGQHLLSAMFQERYGLPTVGFHLGSESSTIDVRGVGPSPEVLGGAQHAANAVIFADKSVTVRYGTADQLAALGVRREVDRQGILRAVEIEGADLQPCGGTHVNSTGQIGMILVRRCTKIRQDWRIEFVCGKRAERCATSDFLLLRSIADELSCAPEEIPPAVKKSAAERDAHFKNLRAALLQLAETRAKLLVGGAEPETSGVRIVAEVLREEHLDLLLPLATEIAKTEQAVALLVHEGSGQLVFAEHPSVGKDLKGILQQVLAEVPGKGGGSRDLVRAKLGDGAQGVVALELARKFVTL